MQSLRAPSAKADARVGALQLPEQASCSAAATEPGRSWVDGTDAHHRLRLHGIDGGRRTGSRRDLLPAWLPAPRTGADAQRSISGQCRRRGEGRSGQSRAKGSRPGSGGAIRQQRQLAGFECFQGCRPRRRLRGRTQRHRRLSQAGRLDEGGASCRSRSSTGYAEGSLGPRRLDAGGHPRPEADVEPGACTGTLAAAANGSSGPASRAARAPA